MSKPLNFILTSALFIFCIYNVDFQGITTPDTIDYLDVSENWFSTYTIHIRPVLYPFILFISGKISSTYAPVIWIQVIAYVISFYFVITFVIPKLISRKSIQSVFSLAVLFAFMAPQTISLLSYVLPEILPLFLVLITIYYTFLHVNNAKSLTALSIAPVLAYLLKPVWIILMLFPFFRLFLAKWINKIANQRQYFIQEIKFTLFYFCIALVAIGAYSIIVKNNALTARKGTILDVNMNLSLLRGGWINNTQESIFYNFIEQNHKTYLEEVREKKFSEKSPEYEFERFSQIKDSIPFEIKSDKYFWRKSLKHFENLIPYLLHHTTLLSDFFTTSASNSKIKLLKNSSSLDYAYQGFYNKIHKIFIIPIYLFILILSFTLKMPNVIFRFFTTCYFLILSYALVTVMLTYQTSLYLRLRGVIEPIILFVPILFAGVLIEIYLKKRAKIDVA